MQVDLAAFFRDEVEQVGVGQPVNLSLQLEAGEDVFDVGREGVQIRSEVGSDVVLVTPASELVAKGEKLQVPPLRCAPVGMTKGDWELKVYSSFPGKALTP